MAGLTKERRSRTPRRARGVLRLSQAQRQEGGQSEMIQAKKTLAVSLLAVVGMLWAAPTAHAQHVESQKAYFGSGTTEILNTTGDDATSGYMKTSNVSDSLIASSMSSALWTSPSPTAKRRGAKTTRRA